MNKIIKFLNDIFRLFIPESRIYFDVEKKREMWNEFSNENNGEIKVIRTVDNTLSRMEMIIPYENYKIVYKESDIHPLKINCVINNKRDFFFQISVEDFIERIMKSINNVEMEIGEKEFDNNYLIVTNDRVRLTRILSNKELRDLLLNNEFTNFQLKKEEENYNLLLLGGFQIDSKNILNDILRIFKIMIDSLNNY
ncbi:MAG: hypothetical protein KAT68_09640 [Bacteroidales bacterium]|nr:hypothetical protein [Bacteroidales bacterium]